MSLGEKIKCAREAANITQEELGRICGTTKQTIYKYEMGIVTNIPFDRLKKIANAVHVPAEQLLGWSDDAQTGEKKEPDPQTGSLSPTKQRLLDAVDDLTDSQIDKLLGIISEAKKLL